jgi:hypothetical protein
MVTAGIRKIRIRGAMVKNGLISAKPLLEDVVIAFQNPNEQAVEQKIAITRYLPAIRRMILFL